VYYNGQPVENITAPINSTGEFESQKPLSFIPTEYGTYTFKVTNYTYTYLVVGSVNKSATYPIPATLTVQSPTISISPYPPEQIVGGLVTITGTCLPPNKPVQVSIGPVNATKLALSGTGWTQVQTYTTPTSPTGIPTGYVKTNSSGGFSGRYVVPLLLPPGPYTVTVNVSGVVWSTKLTILSPTITFSSTHTNITSAYEGEEIYFVGQNFANFTLGYNMTIKLSGYTATCQNNTSVSFGPYGEFVLRDVP